MANVLRMFRSLVRTRGVKIRFQIGGQTSTEIDALPETTDSQAEVAGSASQGFSVRQYVIAKTDLPTGAPVNGAIPDAGGKVQEMSGATVVGTYKLHRADGDRHYSSVDPYDTLFRLTTVV